MRIRARHVVGAVLCYGGGTYAGMIYMRGRSSSAQKDTESEALNVTETQRNERFNAIADKYDREISFSEWTSGIISFRKRLLQHSTGEVLEVAGGTGRNLPYYPTGATVTLTDLSEEMLKVAKEKVDAADTEAGAKPKVQLKLKTVRADASSLPFESDSYDTVVDTFGLCSFENPDKVMKEMQRVCKPGGKILLLEHGRSTHGYSWLNQYLHNQAPAHAKKWGCWWDKDIMDIVMRSGVKIEEERLHHFGTCVELVCVPTKSKSTQQTQ